MAIVMRWDRKQSGPPDRLLFRWTPAAPAEFDPHSVAEKHCLAWNRRAQQVSERAAGDARIAEFVCTRLSDL